MSMEVSHLGETQSFLPFSGGVDNPTLAWKFFTMDFNGEGTKRYLLNFTKYTSAQALGHICFFFKRISFNHTNLYLVQFIDVKLAS